MICRECDSCVWSYFSNTRKILDERKERGLGISEQCSSAIVYHRKQVRNNGNELPSFLFPSSVSAMWKPGSVCNKIFTFHLLYFSVCLQFLIDHLNCFRFLWNGLGLRVLILEINN